MVKAELGDKQVCPNCGAKFYDLRKRPATCPKCATAFDPSDESLRAKRVRTRTPVYERGYDDEKPKVVVSDDDDDEEEVEATPELDEEQGDAVVTLEDEDEGGAADELPAGFSEDDGDLEDDETANEDEIPTLEDEEEFNEDEIGDLPGGDDEDR
jgi:uncharacterized protein (TIGR02300 family)